jgi:hypothetical protein
LKLSIFGGITGFDKTNFIRNFTLKSLEKNGYSADLENDESRSFIHYIKFEDVLLDVTGAVDIPRFLANPSLHEKINLVQRAFSRVGTEIKESEAQHLFLDIHFSCTHQSQLFTPLIKANLNELDPSPDAEIIVVTLIDDVYHIWNTLKEREDEYEKTSLRLREILSWRSVELMQAETVALDLTTTERTRPISNYLYAVRHPFVSLYNLIFSDNPICLYLSYPITKTRNHPERVADINEFRTTMYKIANDLGVCVFDPVTIDELALRNARVEGENCILEAEHRWPLNVELLVGEPDWPIVIPKNEITEAEHDISNGIKPRDFKLIDNSKFTTVYRKNYGGRSEGVNAEILYAISRMKKPYVYDPEEDSDPRAPHPFNPEELIYVDKNVFFDEIVKGINYYKNRRKI